MSVALGYYEDKSGVVFQVSGVAFHHQTGEELVLVRQDHPSPGPYVQYANTSSTVKGPKIIAVPRAIFDNEYPKYLGEWLSYRICGRKPLLSEGKFGRKASEQSERDCDQTSLG
jgi:hypothetical protein